MNGEISDSAYESCTDSGVAAKSFSINEARRVNDSAHLSDQ